MIEAAMNDAEKNQMLEAAWRRNLTPGEQHRLAAWLKSHPEDALAWELESALTASLKRMKDVPAPSNFALGVLQAIDREESKKSTSHSFNPLRLFSRPVWLPRLAWTSLILAAGVWSYQNHLQYTRAQMAMSVKEISLLAHAPVPPASLQTVEVWRDFDTIQRLNTTGPDLELLALLK